MTRIPKQTVERGPSRPPFAFMWEDFHKCGPFSPTETEAARAIFYAGAMSLMELLIDACDDAPRDQQEYLGRLRDELSAFFVELQAVQLRKLQ